MDVKRILHILAAKPEGVSALYVNGEESILDCKEMQTIVDLSFSAGNHRSPWCGTLNGYVFVKGFFVNKGDNGNEMSFSYSAATTEIDAAKQLFLSDIEKNGYKMNQDTERCFNRFTKKSYTAILGCATVAIILTCLLLKLLK